MLPVVKHLKATDENSISPIFQMLGRPWREANQYAPRSKSIITGLSYSEMLLLKLKISGESRNVVSQIEETYTDEKY